VFGCSAIAVLTDTLSSTIVLFSVVKFTVGVGVGVGVVGVVCFDCFACLAIVNSIYNIIKKTNLNPFNIFLRKYIKKIL
jgi:hypothetical protein